MERQIPQSEGVAEIRKHRHIFVVRVEDISTLMSFGMFIIFQLCV